MPEPIRVLSDPAAESFQYRPLSGLALAGFALAVVYSAVIGIYAVMALIAGVPVFLPPWALIFPLIALALAGAARRQIRLSEGSRSGLALAN
jgi:hypothetical protein